MTDVGPLELETAPAFTARAEVLVRDTFEAFYLRELRSVVSLAYSLTGSRATAEDLAQEAFARCYRRWSRVKDYEAPGGFVRRVVANAATSRFRRQRTEDSKRHLLATDEHTSGEQHETERIWGAVRSLPRRQAQVVALRYLEDLTLAEIGDVLGFSVETAKTHLARGKRALAQELGGDR